MITVGMNYEVSDGKAGAFEGRFSAVQENMANTPGHLRTELFRSVSSEGSYLVISEWSSRKDFDAFISSETFRSVTNWGKEKILTRRPSHQVYGDIERTG